MTSDAVSPTAAPFVYDWTSGTSTSDLLPDLAAPAWLVDYNLDPTHEDSYIAQHGEPDGFGLAPTALPKETFLSWHTQEQLAYIYSKLPANNKSGILKLGKNGDTIDVMLSSVEYPIGSGNYSVNAENPGNNTSVVFINFLTLENIRFLSKTDVDRMLNNLVFLSIANELGLVVPAAGQTAWDILKAENSQGPVAVVSFILQQMTTTNNFYDLQKVAKDNIGGAGQIAQDAVDAIVAQIIALRDSSNRNGIVSRDQISTAAQEILDHSHPLNMFAQSIKQADATLPTSSASSVYPGSILADDPASQRNILFASFANMTRAETARAEALAASNHVINGTATNLQGKPLDGPGLLSAFVFNLSLKLQAQNQFDTELFNQLNTLIKSYGVMQRLINETLADFDSGDADQKRSLGGSTSATNINNLGLTPEERAAVSMFLELGNLRNHVDVYYDIFIDQGPLIVVENGVYNYASTAFIGLAAEEYILNYLDSLGSVPLGAANPIEILEEISRPQLDIATVDASYRVDIDFADVFTGATIDPPNFTNASATFHVRDRQQWTTMLQQLNDAVTLLNQNSQLQFNEITTRSQQRTVFFEAASDALTKIDDVLGSMARNMA